MQSNFILDFKEKEIEITVSYSWTGTGIGAYEYWGQKCYDKGENVIQIEDWNYDKTGLNLKEIQEIEELINQNKENWIEFLEDNYELPEPPERDYEYEKKEREKYNIMSFSE